MPLTPSPADAIARLSDKHLAVLALVAEQRVAKEIARELGISEDTVRQRLKRTQTILGVSSRAHAVRLYLAAQREPGIYRQPVYGLRGLAVEADGDNERPSFGFGVSLDDGPDALHQPQAAYSAGFVDWPSKRSRFSWLFEVGRTNDLSASARTVLIFGMTCVAILTVAGAVSVVEGLSRLF